MKVAIVHDYIKEYGGAERVLEALTEIYPDAPIYTAFVKKGSPAWERFKHKKIHTAWVNAIPFFATKLHSPLRFLAPTIWNSFDFSDYDVVITSASWYVTKGVVDPLIGTSKGKRPIEICYCHTPPRWLYGYKTSVELQKYWPVKLYALLVGHIMRMYDFDSAQRVDYFIANSKEVQGRIKKFYRCDSTVIYPPVMLYGLKEENKKQKTGDYYLIVTRIVGSKGLDLAVQSAKKYGFKLKIAGATAGYYTGEKDLSAVAPENVEFLGKVTDEELVSLYSGAKAFLALAVDEDFGITPVESMLCGTPVIAYFGGGFKETVIEGKTGIFIREYSAEALGTAVQQMDKLRKEQGTRIVAQCQKQALKFSKERFMKEMQSFVASRVK